MRMNWTQRKMVKAPGGGVTIEAKQFRGSYASVSGANTQEVQNISLLLTYDAASAVIGGIAQGFSDAERIGKSIDIVEFGLFSMIRQRVPAGDPTCPSTIRTPRRFFVGIDTSSNGILQTGDVAIVQSLCGARNPNFRDRIRQLASVLVVPYVDSCARGIGAAVGDDMNHSSSYQFSYRKKFKKPIRTTYQNAGAVLGSLGTNIPWFWSYSHEKVATVHYQVESHWYVIYKDP